MGSSSGRRCPVEHGTTANRGTVTVASGGWDLALAGVLVIVLGVFVAGVGAGALAVVVSRAIRRRS